MGANASKINIYRYVFNQRIFFLQRSDAQPTVLQEIFKFHYQHSLDDFILLVYLSNCQTNKCEPNNESLKKMPPLKPQSDGYDTCLYYNRQESHFLLYRFSVLKTWSLPVVKNCVNKMKILIESRHWLEIITANISGGHNKTQWKYSNHENLFYESLHALSSHHCQRMAPFSQNVRLAPTLPQDVRTLTGSWLLFPFLANDSGTLNCE